MRSCLHFSGAGRQKTVIKLVSVWVFCDEWELLRVPWQWQMGICVGQGYQGWLYVLGKMMSLLYLVIRRQRSILRLLLKFRLECIALCQRGR